MNAGVDIRARIHDVTLLALTSRRFDRHGMQEVVTAVTEGMAIGAEQSQADLRQALSEAFRGMDHALTRSAEAGGAALRQLAATGKDLSDTEIKQALAHDEAARGRFSRDGGPGGRGDRASDSPRAAPDPRYRARTTGTETGRIAAHSMTELAQRFSVASLDVDARGHGSRRRSRHPIRAAWRAESWAASPTRCATPRDKKPR